MTKSKWIFIILFLSLSMLSFDRLIGFRGDLKNSFSEKANLAIRRTVHLLLKSSGDSTSKIQSVKSLDESTFIIRISKNFNYDLLPQLLAESFKVHQIESIYDVSVLNCENTELELGYNSLDFMNGQNVPCTGRKQDIDCYDLRVSFPKKHPQSASKSFWLIPLWVIFLGGFIYWNRKNVVQKHKPLLNLETEQSDKINFGNSSLDFSNQILSSGNIDHKLTYREAKLLRLFVSNVNQLLERDSILKAVWEDEGIIVGRSLDVFVSRIRKILQDDTSVQIVTLHGVGYKLQVSEK
jgi:DNA-binding winged helix-turn-helix (wHTH) protein